MSTITTEAFDEMLATVCNEHTGEALLSIPGVYEVLSEHFNNEVIERLQRKNEEDCSPLDLGGRIAFSEIQGWGKKAFLHVRVEVPSVENEIPDEYELNFPTDATEEKILKTPLREWRVI